MNRGIFYYYSIAACSWYFALYILDYQELSIREFAVFIINLFLFWFVGSRNKKALYNYWLLPSYLLLLGLIIVNLQTLLNVVFGYGEIYSYYASNYGLSNASKLYYLSLLSITCYLIGLFYFDTSPKQKIEPSHCSLISSPWLLLIVLGFIFFVATIDIASFMSGADYVGSGAYDRVTKASSIPETLLSVFIIIYVVVRSIDAQRNNLPKAKFINNYSIIFWIVFMGYMGLRLVSGDRGPVIYNLILIFYGYVIIYHPKLKLLSILGVVIGGALCVTLLGYTRANVGNASYSDKILKAVDEFSRTERKSIFTPTQELANSIKCNFIAVKDIENRKIDFAYGKYTFWDIAVSIPGSNTFYTKVLGIDLRNVSSSEYITISALGSDYGYGLGSTTFAVFYLDFGILGLIIGFFLMGGLLRKIDYIILFPLHYKLQTVIFASALAMLAIYIPRSSIGFCLSKAIYAVIFYLIFNKLFTLIKFKQFKYA